MALTYATGYTDNQLSSAVNIWWDRSFIPIVVKNNGAVFAMGLAEGGPPTSPNIGKIIRKEQHIEGNQIVSRHMAELVTWNTVADASQLDAVTPVWNNDKIGGRVYDWCHLYAQEWVPASEYAIIRGDAKRTESWLSDVMKGVTEGWLDKLDVGIMSNVNASRTAIGGLQFAIDNTGTYGGVNRATAGNEDFQATVLSRANLTDVELDDLRIAIYQKGGRPKVGLCGATPYKAIMQALKGFVLFNDDQWDKNFANIDRLGYGGVMHVFDHKGSDTDLFYLDPRACRLYVDKSLTHEGPYPLQSRKGIHYEMAFDYWAQFLVVAENWCGRVKDITG